MKKLQCLSCKGVYKTHSKNLSSKSYVENFHRCPEFDSKGKEITNPRCEHRNLPQFPYSIGKGVKEIVN